MNIHGKTAIHCQKCGEFICYQEDLMFFYMTEDIKCPKCGTVVIACNRSEYGDYKWHHKPGDKPEPGPRFSIGRN